MEMLLTIFGRVLVITGFITLLCMPSIMAHQHRAGRCCAFANLNDYWTAMAWLPIAFLLYLLITVPLCAIESLLLGELVNTDTLSDTTDWTCAIAMAFSLVVVGIYALGYGIALNVRHGWRAVLVVCLGRIVMALAVGLGICIALVLLLRQTDSNGKRRGVTGKVLDVAGALAALGVLGQMAQWGVTMVADPRFVPTEKFLAFQWKELAAGEGEASPEVKKS